jgi:hypothetical protein
MRFLTTLALATAFVLPGCQSTPEFSPSPASASVEAWSHSVDRIRPPAVGCFTLSFPSKQWSPVACSTAANLHSHTIGENNDYMAVVAPRAISSAEGSFPDVVGLRSVDSKNVGRGWSGVNSYSLQLNSQYFATSSCGTIAHCLGWVQFVYQNPPGKRGGSLYIWDWLVSSTRQKLSGCPPKAGWQDYGAYCVQTSHKSVAVPNQPIALLSKMTLAGMAASDGDSIIFGVGGTKYAVRNAQSDDVADLSAHWQGAEFNVFAPGNAATATFNAGATIVVGLEVQDGVTTAPVCRGNAGTTAETNNLSFVKTTGPSPATADPSIRFTESNVASTGRPSCRALAGTGTKALVDP